jgi:hypothetical protein
MAPSMPAIAESAISRREQRQRYTWPASRNRRSRLLVEAGARALPRDLAVPFEPEGFQRAQDLAIGAGHRARAIDILDAHPPLPTLRPRIEPARDRRPPASRSAADL